MVFLLLMLYPLIRLHTSVNSLATGLVIVAHVFILAAALVYDDLRPKQPEKKEQ